MNPWRRALKYLLPHGLTEVPRYLRRLRELGREPRPGDWWKSEWLLHEAETTGLDLMPAGHWRGLRTVVDVGANTGQWSTMLLDLVTPEKLIIVEPEPAAFRELERAFGARTSCSWS